MVNDTLHVVIRRHVQAVSGTNCVDKRKATGYDEFMRYVVNELGEGATDAVEASCEQEAAETFAERQYEALRSEFPKGGITVEVRRDDRVTAWHVGIDWAPSFCASEAQEGKAA